MNLNSISNTNFNGILYVSGIKTSPQNIAGSFMEKIPIHTSDIMKITGLQINPDYAAADIGLRFYSTDKKKAFTESIREKVNNTAILMLKNKDKIQVNIPVEILEKIYTQAKQSDEIFYVN